MSIHAVANRYPVGMYKDIHPFGVRLPSELREKVAKSAEQNHRSMNAELVAVIHEHYRERVQLRDFTDGELIGELIRRFGRESFIIQVVKKET